MLKSERYIRAVAKKHATPHDMIRSDGVVGRPLYAVTDARREITQAMAAAGFSRRQIAGFLGVDPRNLISTIAHVQKNGASKEIRETLAKVHGNAKSYAWMGVGNPDLVGA